jgi:hypothetical protein
MPIRSLSAAFVGAALCLAPSAALIAQSLPSPVVCGTQAFTERELTEAAANTARTNPALYARMLARVSEAKSGSTRMLSADGKTVESYFVYNNRTAQFDNVQAVLAYDGVLARVWIDVLDTARVTPQSSQFRMLVRALDTATGPQSHDPSKGILANDIELFGQPPTTYQIEGKTDFLLTDIKEAIQGGYIAGYFSQQDQTPNVGSNLRNILYIDSREGLSSTTSLLNTIAHEYQHLIHYARRRNGELFYNEGCSELASILAGYWNRTNNGYMANTNVDMLSWPSGTTNGSLLLATYERAMTFMHFVEEQYGERFLYEFVGASSRGLSRIDEALKKADLYSDDVNAKTALRYFAVANYLQTSDDARYGYELKVGTRKPTLASSYTATTLPTSGSFSVNRYATSYMQIAGAGPQTMRFTGITEFRVMAMIFVDGTLEVRDLEPNTTYTFGGAGAADKTVLAFVNLGGIANTIAWTTDVSTAGAASETGAAARASIQEIAPNPVRTEATIRFVSIDRGPVTLELFDVRGARVRTLVDAEMMDAGSHEVTLDVEGLPAGYYMASLRQGSQRSTHVVVVSH